LIGVLAEDDSDVKTLKVLIRRLAADDSLRIQGKGFQGGGELFRKGARHVQLFQNQRASHFVICHDADGPDPSHYHERVLREIVRSANIEQESCIVIPVQEIEAWVLANIPAVSNIFGSWRPEPVGNPESIASPKEHLRRLSRDGTSRPRYVHSIHNEHVAQYLDLDKVRSRCPSFRPLVEFVQNLP